MITLKHLRWSNVFSYGADNFIDFEAAPLLQLIGKNGHGKSSVALILEEVLFNKNSKGIKKSDIINRYVDATKYTITVSFDKDGDEYVVRTTRGSTQTVQITCNGKDVSEHTSTASYKLIEQILGFDHKTFTQIVYQSSAYSLEFLTATDSTRKKFLIELLNLTKYTDAAETIKAIAKDVSLEAEGIDAKLTTVRGWLAKFGSADLNKQDTYAVPELLTQEPHTVASLEVELINIDATNKKITQNNKYKEILAGIELTTVEKPLVDLMALKIQQSKYLDTIDKANKVIKGTGPVKQTCNYCGQKVDESHKQVMIDEAKKEIALAQPLVSNLNAQILKANMDNIAFNQSQQAQLDWEKYHGLINHTLPTALVDKNTLEQDILKTKKKITDRNAEIATVTRKNNEIVAHNTKIDVILQQMDTMQSDLLSYGSAYTTLAKRLSNLQVLVKTFSTTGLVAYKIECLVKDLEALTNKYLLDMSDGRFQINFRINSSDKLNVIINDNGNDIDILALSNGERARVNISTLLAIRSLMQSLSNCRINLLILDETVESLDTDGKEKLVEVLLGEDHLNTILVSHGFNHPLLEKVNVIKENNISRIE